MGLLEVDSFCFLIRRMRFMRNMRSLLGVLKRHSDLFFKAFMVLLVSSSLQAAEGQGQNEHRGAVLRDYCVACHNEQLRTAGLVLETSDLDPDYCNRNDNRLGSTYNFATAVLDPNPKMAFWQFLCRS